MRAEPDLRLEPWDDRALDFERRANVPEMKTYLGGVEAEEALVSRHRRILDLVRDGRGRMFLIVLPGEPDPVGSVGFWDRDWLGGTVYEMGWKVLPARQGRGLAVRATVVARALAAAEGRHRWAHAYPKVDNAASNAVCRRAGFELLGECDFEYPAGHPLRCHDWRYDLTSVSGSATGSGSTSSRA